MFVIHLTFWLVIPVHQAGLTNRLIKQRAVTTFASFTHNVEVSSNSLSAATQDISHGV